MTPGSKSTPGSQGNPVTEFARLARRKHDLKAKIKAIEVQMDALQPRLLDAYQAADEQGLPAVRDVAHGMKLTAVQDTSVRLTEGTDTADLVSTLIKNRRRELVGINWPAFLSYVKTRVAKGTLPESIARHISIMPNWRIKAQRHHQAKRRGGKS